MSHFSVAVISKTPDDVDDLLAPFQENNMDDCPKEYLSFVEDEDFEVDEEVGKQGYWENPNSKWDWWQVGGRWSGSIKTKDGRKVDSCRLKEIDLSPNQAVYNHAIRFWEINVEGQDLRPDEDRVDYLNFYKPQYYIDSFGVKEAYAAHEAAFLTYAMVTPDGAWHGKGEMGWFGISDQTKDSISTYQESFKKALEESDQDHFLTVVDCHI